MSEAELYGRRFGKMVPIVVRGTQPSLGKKIQGLVDAAGDVSTRRNGWMWPRRIEGMNDAMTVIWAQFHVVSSSLTQSQMDDVDRTLVVDVPFEGQDARLLLIQATGPPLQTVASRYVEDTRLDEAVLTRLQVDSELLKAFFQEEGLYDIVTAVEGTERSFGTHYEGDTRIKGIKAQDVRNDSKFPRILDDEWKSLKVIPKPEAFDIDMPPTVALANDGTIRIWRPWSDKQSYRFLQRLCGVIWRLQGAEVREELLEAAAAPPNSQMSLSEFF